MSKRVEKYIDSYTRNCSNELVSVQDRNGEDSYYPWLTPDHARSIAQIAREDAIDETVDWLKKYLRENNYSGIIDLCDEYIHSMVKTKYIDNINNEHIK